MGRDRFEQRERGAVPARLEPRARAREILARGAEVAAPRAQRSALEPEPGGFVARERVIERRLRGREPAAALVRDRERAPQPRVVALGRERLEPRLRLRPGALIERGQCGSHLVGVAGHGNRRIEIGEEARTLGQELGERRGIAVPRREHRGEILQRTEHLDEPRRGDGERPPADRAAAGRGALEAHPFLAGFAPRVERGRGRAGNGVHGADPGRAIASVARDAPARHGYWIPPRLDVRLPCSMYSSR